MHLRITNRKLHDQDEEINAWWQARRCWEASLNPEGNAKVLTTTIPEPLIEKLNAIAEKWDLSRNAALARIIREYRPRR